jgi:serine/threonine-protein kinase
VTELGQGPLGPLFGARVTSGGEEGRLVAVRRISMAVCGLDEAKRVLDAAEIARRVRHSKLAAVIDVVAIDREIAVIGEYVDGPTLSTLQRLAYAKRSPFSPAVALRIGVEILQGLRAAREAWKFVAPHALRGALHGCISPDTVFVAALGDVLIAEIGFSSIAATLGPYRWLPGLLSYRSPEELGNGERSVDERADIFRLGVILWELLANRPLFGDPERFGPTGSAGIHAEVVARTQRDIQSMQIPSLGAKERDGAPIARSAIEVVERALGRDPATRFSSIDQMLGALLAMNRDVVAGTDQVRLALNRLAQAEIEAQRVAIGSPSSVRPPSSSGARRDSSGSTLPPRPSASPAPAPTLPPRPSTAPAPAPTPPAAAKAQSESLPSPSAQRPSKLPPMRKLQAPSVPPPPARSARPSSLPPAARLPTIPPPQPPPARLSSIPPPAEAQTARPATTPPPPPVRAVRPKSTPPPPPVRKPRPTSTPPTAPVVDPVAEPPTSPEDLAPEDLAPEDLAPEDLAPEDPTPAAPVIAAPVVSGELPRSLEAPEAVRHAPDANAIASVAPIEIARPADAPRGALTTSQRRARRIFLAAAGVVGVIALLGLLRARTRPATATAEASMPQATQSVASPQPAVEKAPVPKPVAHVPPAAPAAASVDEPPVTTAPPREAPPRAVSKALPAAKALPVAPVWARPPSPPPPPGNGGSGTERPEPPPKPYRPKRI